MPIGSDESASRVSRPQHVLRFLFATVFSKKENRMRSMRLVFFLRSVMVHQFFERVPSGEAET